MSYQTNKLEWFKESSPNGNIIVRGGNLVFERFSKKSMARLNYMARKEKLSLRGFIIKCIIRGSK